VGNQDPPESEDEWLPSAYDVPGSRLWIIVQLLNTPPFYVSQQPQQEGQRATGQAFQQASEQWMALAQKQQQTYQQMSQQWMEQAQTQQQAFQQIVQKSLSAYADLFKPPSA
jgi:shikimate kinase